MLHLVDPRIRTDMDTDMDRMYLTLFIRMERTTGHTVHQRLGVVEPYRVDPVEHCATITTNNDTAPLAIVPHPHPSQRLTDIHEDDENTLQTLTIGCVSSLSTVAFSRRHPQLSDMDTLFQVVRAQGL